jgi:hypothetical protein
MVTGTATARTWKLESRGHFGLCREYDENLRSFPELRDMTTEWPLARHFKNFSKPKWQQVAPVEHIDVLKDMYEFQRKEWPDYQEEVNEWVRAGEVRLEKTVLDFDASGKKSVVYRYKHPAELISQNDRARVPVQAYWYMFYAADADAPVEAYRRYATWFSFGDSFLYKGRFYLIRSLPDLTIYEPRYVASVNELAMTPVCVFRLSRARSDQ